MNTLHITQSIVDRLKLKLPALHVDFFPEDPERFTLTHPMGAVLVSYGSSDYGKQKDMAIVIQPQALKFTATLIMRQLNGRGGAVDALDYVRQALGGWKPPDCRQRISLVSDRFIGQAGGLWQYVLTFATETVFIQDDDPDDNAPLLKSINPVGP